jgi:hypothetical protein
MRPQMLPEQPVVTVNATILQGHAEVSFMRCVISALRWRG